MAETRFGTFGINGGTIQKNRNKLAENQQKG
jgi:hypothetical protein